MLARTVGLCMYYSSPLFKYSANTLDTQNSSESMWNPHQFHHMNNTDATYVCLYSPIIRPTMHWYGLFCTYICSGEGQGADWLKTGHLYFWLIFEKIKPSTSKIYFWQANTNFISNESMYCLNMTC